MQIVRKFFQDVANPIEMAYIIFMYTIPLLNFMGKITRCSIKNVKKYFLSTKYSIDKLSKVCICTFPIQQKTEVQLNTSVSCTGSDMFPGITAMHSGIVFPPVLASQEMDRLSHFSREPIPYSIDAAPQP